MLYSGYWFTFDKWIFTPVSNSLTLHCDNFDHGSEQTEFVQVSLLTTVLTSEFCSVQSWRFSTSSAFVKWCLVNNWRHCCLKSIYEYLYSCFTYSSYFYLSTTVLLLLLIPFLMLKHSTNAHCIIHLLIIPGRGTRTRTWTSLRSRTRAWTRTWACSRTSGPIWTTSNGCLISTTCTV